ncbi:MAG: hypothetical protein GF408_03490 [Candidatus Omnitrophica bacterium]|nr:hypothetical protein [Candidatus Omnitrophota bacterium]
MKRTVWVLLLFLLLVTTFSVTCFVFESPFAEATIDWFAFLAGIFLMSEGLYKIITRKDGFFPEQFLRAVRAVIGMCVFTIHLLQFMRF